ncbi:hypothetical protein GCM10009846_27460 [Agrococcus versicolor]|uniref:Lipoprotein n=1 Tax=Agrococcus versicolor TaxID=501482 RepID=A0ABN3AWV2_9MICO
MPARRAPLLVTLAAATAIGLTGCIPQPPAAPVESAPPATSAPATSAEPTESEEAEESAPAVAGEETAPGTELAFGEPATISWDPLGEGAQLVSVTVTGVREGSIADFEAAGLEQDFIDQLVGYEPMYVDIELTKLEPATAELAFNSIYTDFEAVDANGTGLQSISVFGDFAPCDTASIEPEVDSGAVHTTCIIVATREGQEFGGAIYAAYDTPYADYDGQPIVWR